MLIVLIVSIVLIVLIVRIIFLASSLGRAASCTLSMVRCRVCHHAMRDAIEAACDTRTTAAVADQYGLSELALERHLALHATALSAPISGARLIEDAPATLRCTEAA